VRVVARRREQAARLIADLECAFPNLLSAVAFSDLAVQAAACEAPLIINTTPLGMEPYLDDSPWPTGLSFPAGSFVYDLVYTPWQTRLLRQAATAGCDRANGLGMLAMQAAQSFMLWTGAEAGIVEHFIKFASETKVTNNG